MCIKKKIKGVVSSFFLKGVFKEKLKLKYYNLNSKSNIDFSINMNERNSIIYSTHFNGMKINTKEPLYTIAPDFDYYQHYYKVKSDDIIIDGGANFGHLSLLFLKTIKTGFVYCFEPDKYNIERLKNNLILNKEISNNYKIIDLLMWNKNELINFQESGTVASSAHWFSSDQNIVKKQAITLDEWSKIHNIKKLDFVKMDIEGAEVEAIYGAKMVIEQFKPNFAIASYHMVNDKPTHIALESFFESINYPYKTLKFRGNEIITFAGPSVEKSLI